MKSPNHFWLGIHHLFDSYTAEGRSTEERTARIIAEILKSPPAAQRKLLSEMAQLALTLPELYPQVMAAVKEQERAPQTGP